MRRVGQLLELPEPTELLALLVGAEQIIEHVAFADVRYRGIDPLRFVVERLDGRFIELGSLRVGVELAIGVRHRKIGFLHRSVQQVAIMELSPRRQGFAILTQSGIGPTHTQQGAC